MKKKNQGFTLIELIVVVAVLVLLLLILVPKLSGFAESSADTAAAANIKTMDRLYWAADAKLRALDHVVYPKNESVLINANMPSQETYDVEILKLLLDSFSQDEMKKYIIYGQYPNELRIYYYPKGYLKNPFYKYEVGSIYKCSNESCAVILGSN